MGKKKYISDLVSMKVYVKVTDGSLGVQKVEKYYFTVYHQGSSLHT